MPPLHLPSNDYKPNCLSSNVVKSDEHDDDVFTTETSVSTSEASSASRECEVRESSEESSGVLFRAIKEREWDKVVNRATAHPEEASQWVVISDTPDKQPERLMALHYACSLDAPIHVIEVLIEADPSVVRRPDQSGRILLHWAADHLDSSTDLFDTILSQYPEGARVREHKYGCTPLHVACCRKRQRSDGKVINRLLEVFPEAALCRDKRKGWLPLHVATRNGAPPAVIEALTMACPTSAALGDDDGGRLPIHYVARYADKWQIEELEKVVTAVVESYPAGLKRRERACGHTPLAVACSTHHPPKTMKVLISLLLKHGQAAISIPGFDQSLPIHIGSRAQIPLEVMRDLLIANPMAAAEQDKNGRTALHWACQMDAPAEIIDMLLRVNPCGAAVIENKYGFTPLLCALHQHAEIAVITSLLANCPRASRVKDKHGSLPIHAVCKKAPNSNSSAVIEMLTKAYPESTRVKDRNGRTPIDLFVRCQSNKNPDAAILKLLEENASSDSASITALTSNGSVSESNSSTDPPVATGLNCNSSGRRSFCTASTPVAALQKGGVNIVVSIQDIASAQVDPLCFFCKADRSDYTIRPCSHIRLCSSCAKERVPSLNHVCPIESCFFDDAVRLLIEC